MGYLYGHVHAASRLSDVAQEVSYGASTIKATLIDLMFLAGCIMLAMSIFALAKAFKKFRSSGELAFAKGSIMLVLGVGMLIMPFAVQWIADYLYAGDLGDGINPGVGL